MPKVTVLDVRLYGEPVATLTNLQDGCTLFAFNEDYIEDDKRPTLSLSYKDPFGLAAARIAYDPQPTEKSYRRAPKRQSALFQPHLS